MLSFYQPPLLQGLQMFEIKEKSPVGLAVFFVGVGIIAAVIIFLNISKFMKNNAAIQGTAGVGGEGKLKVSSDFFSYAKQYGLSRLESARLERILKGAGNPIKVLHNNELLDDEFKREVQSVQKETDDEDDAINQLASLYAIRNAIDYFNSAAKVSKGALRSFRRKDLKLLACSYAGVDTVKEKSGNTMKKKLVLSKEKLSGDLINISLGGCALKPSKIIKAGKLIKIDFSIKRQTVGVLGQVVRINVDGRNSVMHIKFLKITKKAQNIINALIFDY